jgi:hypothetical protein
MDKVKVKILVDTVADKKCVKKGDIISLAPSEARLLCGIKKAELAKEDDEKVVKKTKSSK